MPFSIPGNNWCRKSARMLRSLKRNSRDAGGVSLEKVLVSSQSSAGSSMYLCTCCSSFSKLTPAAASSTATTGSSSSAVVSSLLSQKQTKARKTPRLRFLVNLQDEPVLLAMVLSVSDGVLLPLPP